MAILNAYTDPIGQTGVVPHLIYIQTNDTLAAVATAGYLDHLVSQGILVSDMEMAVVSTKTSPNARASATNLYSISFSGGHCQLTLVGGSPGGNAWLLGGNAVSGTQTLSSTDNVILQSNTGTISLLAPNAGQFAYITAANVSIAGSAAVNITGGALTLNMSGSAFVGATGPLSFQGSSVAIVPASVANVVTANVLYYNTSTGVVTRGAPGAIDTSLNYTWTGTNQFNGPFGVNASSGDVTISSAAQNVNILATTAAKAVNIQSPTVAVVASTLFSVSSATMSLQTTGTGGLNIAAGGILSLQGALGINLPTLASAAATANVVYYNTGTGYITYAAAPSGGMTWSNVTGTSQAMAVSNGYVANNASLVTLTLPAVASVGQIVAVSGNGAGGWSVAQNASQIVHIGSVASTAGVGGSVASTNRYDCVELICTVANLEFVARSSFGNLNIT